jgi:putative Holliday junction resolvase
MRYLAIDYGAKRCGLAVCDPLEMVVSPLEVIDGRRNLIKRIVEVIEAEGIEAVVLGLPLNMDNSAGRQAEVVKEFSKRLKKKINLTIHFQDERLSSFAAKERLADIELTRKEKRKRFDAVAAAFILESFLEQKKRERSQR